MQITHILLDSLIALGVPSPRFPTPSRWQSFPNFESRLEAGVIRYEVSITRHTNYCEVLTVFQLNENIVIYSNT